MNCPGITHIQAWPVTMRLAEPYIIAYETVEQTTNVFLRVETDMGVVGCGCAAPDQEVCGENADGVLQATQDTIKPMLEDARGLDFESLLKQLTVPLTGRPAALAMVDMALWDIRAKLQGLPLYRVLGGDKESITTSVTIGILSEDETVSKAKDWVSQGFVCLKLKGGLDHESDAARVLKVREAVGDGVALRFDVNQGYTIEESVAFEAKVRPARLQLIEQPTPANRLDLLKGVSAAIDVPVMADESLKTLGDAEAICGQKAADMLNIKLMKVGGISSSVRIVELAAAAGMPVMVGCMDDSALAIAAGLHLALALPNIRYADLDAHLDLLEDPTEGAVILENGWLRPTGKPGLGFDLLAGE